MYKNEGVLPSSRQVYFPVAVWDLYLSFLK